MMSTPQGTPSGRGRGTLGGVPYSALQADNTSNRSDPPPLGAGGGLSPGGHQFLIGYDEYRRLRLLEVEALAARARQGISSSGQPGTGNPCCGGHCGRRERYPMVNVTPYDGGPTGAGLKKFLQTAEQLKVGQHLGDRIFLDRWVPTLLVDEALDWFSAQPTFNSWNEFKAELTGRFQLPNADDVTYEMILARQQGSDETVEAYVKDMLHLFRRMQVPLREAERVRLVFRNLKDPMRVLVSSQVHDNVQSLVAHAQRLEAAAKLNEFSVANPGPVPPAPVAPPRQPRSSQADRYCYICGEAEHFARSCPCRVRPDSSGRQGNDRQGNDRGGSPRPGTTPRGELA